MKKTWLIACALVVCASTARADVIADWNLSDAARDVVDARIYMGIHFHFADTVALRQGTHVANWAFAKFLRPISD